MKYTMMVQCWDDGMQKPWYGATLDLVILAPLWLGLWKYRKQEQQYLNNRDSPCLRLSVRSMTHLCHQVCIWSQMPWASPSHVFGPNFEFIYLFLVKALCSFWLIIQNVLNIWCQPVLLFGGIVSPTGIYPIHSPCNKLLWTTFCNILQWSLYVCMYIYHQKTSFGLKLFI